MAEWINPYYNPGQNAAGYTRFDASDDAIGAGLERARTYKDGAWLFDQYTSLDPSTQGYDHGQSALRWLQKEGIDPAQATDEQKFKALDAEFRGIQYDNTKTNKFGDSILGKVLGVGLPFATNLLLPGSGFLAAGLKGAAGGALGSGIFGGNVLKGAGLGFGGGLIGEGARNLWNSGGTSLLGSNEAFTNPDALGIGASNLYNPDALGGAAATSTPNGLGLNALDWATGVTPETWAGTVNNPDGGFFNPGAFGSPNTNPGIANALYNPVSLGGPTSSGISPELAKLGLDALGAFLEPDAPVGGGMAISTGASGGGAPRAPYIGAPSPALQPLPQYFGFNQNPFNALGGYGYA